MMYMLLSGNQNEQIMGYIATFSGANVLSKIGIYMGKKVKTDLYK